MHAHHQVKLCRQWEWCPSELSSWKSGRGLVVRVLDSGFMVVGSIPILGMVRFWSLGNFIYPDLPQYAQLQMSTTIVGKVPAMD